MEIVNLTNSQVLAREARVADSFFTRLRGLLGSAGLPAGGGLVITPCNSVHTFGMNYPIDVVFADGDHRVLKTVSAVKPWRTAACRGSRYVVELPAGVVAASGTAVGDFLSLTP